MRLARILVAGAAFAAVVACSSSATRPVTVALPGPDRAYAVAAPPDTSTGGGAVPKPPDCAPNAPLQTSATTRVAAGGVVGLVTLRASGCALEVDASSIRLVGRGGEALPVVLSHGNPVNPAGSKRPDIAQYAGNVLMGFAWSGSYCGQQAISVRVTIVSRKVLIPFQGPVPSCRKGVSGTLVPGVLKEPGQAVEPAPVAWGALRARVVLPAATGQAPIPLVVVITNAGKVPVSLADPCPDYLTTTSLAHGKAGHQAISVYGGGGDLCGHPLVVKPGVPLTLKLGTLAFPAFSDLPRTPTLPGDPVTVTWSMAGVPEASATTHIR
jgi:hypothetical protein